MLTVGQSITSTELLKAETPLNDESTSVNISEQHPVIFFENADFNFGKIFKGQKVEYVYKFENRGKGILEISKVKTSCGCTAAMLTNKIISPGKTGEIKATFNSGSYKGNVTKSITVLSNDPNSPKYKLTLSGEIIEEIIVKPRNINFGSIYLGTKIDKTITIKSLTEPNFKIKKITPLNLPISRLSFSVALMIYSSLFLSTIEAFTNGLDGVIYLQTDNPRQPKATIPFFGEIIGDITTYPKKIYYGRVIKGKEITQKIFVKINKNDIKILNSKVSPDYLSTKIIEKYEKNNPHYLIEIKLNKEATIGKLNGLLELQTNSKIQPTIRIPIIGEIQKG